MIDRPGQTLLLILAVFCLAATGCSVTSPASSSDDGRAPGVEGIPQTGAGTTTYPVVPRVSDVLLDGLVLHMTTAELVGQMFMISLERDGSGQAVVEISEEEQRLIQTVSPGGVILFGPNIVSVAQVQELVSDLQRFSAVPLLVATDHEGGNVSRLTSSEEMPATVMPSETLLGIAVSALVRRGEESRVEELATGWGRTIGTELRALGITMNLAPVADVDNPDQPGLLGEQRRTFGTDPALVAALVASTVHGMHSAGVSAVLKHFPGQGSATLDSHNGTVALEHTRARLDSVDLVPFVAGINAGVRAVMSAHISYPVITGTDEPATVSRQLITGVLRGELGFEGVVLTDALTMDAVATGRSTLDLALSAIGAGADMMLQPDDPVALHAALVEATNSGMVTRDRLIESVRRILRLKLQAGLFGPSVSWTDSNAARILGSADHLQLVEEIRAVARSGRD